MWKRFVRAMRALFGGAISAIEDPKLILEQNIREMRDQVPKMNSNIASIKATVTLLEKELQKCRQEEATLISKIKAAISQGRDDIAANYALRLESIRSEINSTLPQLQTAQMAYEKAMEVKKVFIKETERKIKEAQDAMRAHERAQMQAKIADALESFEVGGIDQTHNEMLARINEQTAKNEAKVEMALDSIDTTSMKIDEEAEKLRAMDLVSQFKLEMGMTGTSTSTQDPGIQTDTRNQQSTL
jgi:phage shock protein A